MPPSSKASPGGVSCCTATIRRSRGSATTDTTHQSTDDSSISEHSRLTTLEGQQRVSFERYLEARMEFLEFRFDESNRPGAGLLALPMRDTEYSGIGSRPATELQQTLTEMELTLNVCTEMCPYCNKVNVVPGSSAYYPRYGPGLSRRVQN